MSESSQAAETREERLRRFAELDDNEQTLALAWFDLVKESDTERYIAAEELLSSGPLAQETKSFLIRLLTPDILGTIRQSYDDLRKVDSARGDARDEAEMLGYDWVKRRSRRKYRDRYRDDLDFYSEILTSEQRATPKIAAYVEILRERYDTEGE